MSALLSDAAVIERVFDHIDNRTTDEGEFGWQEPTEHYADEARFQRELELLRRLPIPFCPSAAIPEPGSYVAREAAGVPLVIARGEDGVVRGFRNACRHRGMQVAEGSGQTKAFICRYHGWTYQLDGTLRNIPHEHGFPDFDKSCNGLVPVHVEERHGLVWVTQDEPVGEGALATSEPVAAVLTPDQRVFQSRETSSDLNWKLNTEATLEGYHIKPTHRETFYPYGFDNLNVVENFGANSRVTFPFRRIEKLRNMTPEQRRIDGMVTYVYQLFPNVTVAVLSNHTSISIAEPVSTTFTRFFNYRLTNRETSHDAAEEERANRDANFVTDTGGKEDAAVIRAIQAGLASKANTHFTYGKFEKAIVHFHQNLTEHLDRL